MYDYVNGIFNYKRMNDKGYYATVEACGVGYCFEVMERDYALLPEEGTPLKLFSVLIHREDRMSLCGFLKREDRDLFNVLTSVSGVGSKMALTLLNSFKVSDLISFVIEGDYKELTKAKGVGPKLAQKIILELKDKLNSYTEATHDFPSSNISKNTESNQNIKDAKMVLLSLGYAKDEVSESVDRAIKSISSDATAEEILKKSLQILSLV